METPSCRVVSKSHRHPKSAAIPVVSAQFRGWPCPQTNWSRCHVITGALCPLGDFLQTLFVLVPSQIYCLLPVFFGCSPASEVLCPPWGHPPEPSSQERHLPDPDIHTWDPHSSYCQELSAGTFLIRLQKAFCSFIHQSHICFKLRVDLVYFRAINCSLIIIHKHRNAWWCSPATSSLNGDRAWPEVAEGHGRWTAMSRPGGWCLTLTLVPPFSALRSNPCSDS